MAAFGVQLAFSMILASIISKIGGKYSLARYLLCRTGLIRYLHPTDEELREMVGIKRDLAAKGKGKAKPQDMKNPNTFQVPKNLSIQLDSVEVRAPEVIHLRFYAEYQWMVDFSLYSTILYIVTEIYYGLLQPTNEMNLSVFWCLLSLFLCLRVLVSLTAVYFRGDEVMGERSMCMCMGLVYLLVAMVILILKEETLEVGVDPAYQSFYENASAFLKTQGLPSSGPVSKLIVKFIIAVACAVLGSFFTFPGIRMSKMFWDTLRYCEGRLLLKCFININYILPFLLALLWVKPIGREMFTATPIGKDGVTLMTDETFDTMRLYLVVAFVILRIILMPWHLQAYLNVAQDKLNEQITEAGRTTNTQIQKKVAGIFYLLCMVALQYIAPVLLCLHCALLYKTLGGASWMGSLSKVYGTDASAADGTTPASFLPENDSIKPAAEHWLITLASLKQVFNALVFKGIFGFATWWGVFLLFASSAVGSAYLTFLSSG